MRRMISTWSWLTLKHNWWHRNLPDSHLITRLRSSLKLINLSRHYLMCTRPEKGENKEKGIHGLPASAPARAGLLGSLCAGLPLWGVNTKNIHKQFPDIWVSSSVCSLHALHGDRVSRVFDHLGRNTHTEERDRSITWVDGAVLTIAWRTVFAKLFGFFLFCPFLVCAFTPGSSRTF